MLSAVASLLVLMILIVPEGIVRELYVQLRLVVVRRLWLGRVFVLREFVETVLRV